MASDLRDRGQRDRDRIDIEDEYDIRHWSQRFNVSADKLKAAVDKAGPVAEDVAKALGKSL
ncbi:MAG TPA: DUF3606 domain-containing protein [Alphaproteobacteria bacterium]|jgi:hypothetical protein|nr:DUF3606 domain-containing protein [Alphaproteobacteria bacterium]